jgi:RimJ/RimL family protein N-acetyltransferase
VGIAPLYLLRIRTPRLELRLGSHDELLELGRLAELGVHAPDEMPFAVAWTDGIGQPDFLESFVAFHEGALAAWSPQRWTLNLLVWEHGTLVGTQSVSGKGAHARGRPVTTGSWIGLGHQRRGIGTEMRAAVLELAFRGLGAAVAASAWLEGNEASRRVSEKLGYVEVGVGQQSPRGAPVLEHKVVIEHASWLCPGPVEIEGLEPCLPSFGL